MEKKIQESLVEAMKEGNKNKVSALRAVKSAIQNEKTNGTYHELSDNDIIKIIQKQVKQRIESEEIYRNANRNDLAEKEMEERKYLEEYLPKMLNSEELTDAIKSIITEANASTIKDMGRVMKELSNRFPNQYDGKEASTIIKSILV